jgi:hypothetical protein
MTKILFVAAAIVTLATFARAAPSSASFGIGITIVAEGCGPGLARGPHRHCQAIVHAASCRSSFHPGLERRRC